MATHGSRKKTANLLHEHQYYAIGCRLIVGIDEAGRGAWAGPVAAGAVCLPLDNRDLSKIMRGVNDSKQLSAPQRSNLVDKIRATAITWGVGSSSHQEIDTDGILPATHRAMERALEDALARQPGMRPDALFIDATLIPALFRIPQVSLIGGDARSLSIAAASILAKVWRDREMDTYDATYPQYGFISNKGYGGGEMSLHHRALKEFGPSPIHRMTFAPVAASLRRENSP
ncbi:MAG: ribonuclease HII [Chloroflexota bacterium]|nr:ribonuclease HII [Chloroflexota bacterium]